MVPAHSIKVSRVSMYSGSRSVSSSFAYGAFTLSGRLSQNLSADLLNLKCGPNPGVHALRFGLFPFRCRYFGNRKIFFLFLALLRCFSSGGSPPYVMDWRMDAEVCSCGFPHSDIADQWIFAPPRSFCSLSRLSSALSAKASTIRSY